MYSMRYGLVLFCLVALFLIPVFPLSAQEGGTAEQEGSSISVSEPMDDAEVDLDEGMETEGGSSVVVSEPEEEVAAEDKAARPATPPMFPSVFHAIPLAILLLSFLTFVVYLIVKRFSLSQTTEQITRSWREEKEKILKEKFSK